MVAPLLFLLVTTAASLNPDSIRTGLPLLSTFSPATEPILQHYHHRYGLDSLGCIPVIGTFSSDSFTCVGQIYPADSARGTVFFLHGYLDHTGTLVNGIRACLQEHWTVATVDLPGHGLSSGERGAINDFAEYSGVLGTFIEICSSQVARPIIFIGHSTGCAVGLEYLHHAEYQPFVRMVFLAPLVRGALFHLSRFGNTVLSPFTATLPRWFRKASHDREFLKRFRVDPLQTEIFPMRWASAYYVWHDRIERYPQWRIPLTVVQGTDDNIVEWRYNVPWLEHHVAGVRVVRIDHARHQLLNETALYRNACLEVIGCELRDAVP